ncbi:MAG: hypothetical protein ACFNUN_02840 [Aggregatibacter sp.]|uniref:hypothetical protein n=1 Tax=Aggregatibacter sp. TaxID=1872413 RepID=UPI00361A58AD
MKKQFMQWLLSKDELVSSNAEYITARLDENLKIQPCGERNRATREENVIIKGLIAEFSDSLNTQ